MVKKPKKEAKNVKRENIKQQDKQAPEDKTTLADIINNADQAVIITTSKGNVEVTGIKDINYAYQVKGLLIGAMDVYNSRPVINGMNNNARALLAHLSNINAKIDKIIAEIPVEPVVEEEGKE